MVGCEIYSNSSSSKGGGIFNAGNAPQFINSVFAKNSASSYGSGMFLAGWTVSFITNSTIAANDGQYSSIYYDSGPYHSIRNSIVWGNETGLGGQYLSNSTVMNSDIQGGWSYTGTGNIDDDPLYSAPEDNDFSLRCASPAKDAGTSDGAPADDLNGNPRPYSTTNVDMGAYEYQSLDDCPAPSSYTVGVGGDFSTIQSAINAAKDGDTISVDPGTYYENIDFIGKDVKVFSYYPELTVIDGGTAGNVVTMATYEGKGAVLDGFTIMDGYAATNGGGISIANFATPSITNCIITSNSGNGVYVGYASVEITNSEIISNTNEGIEAYRSNLTVDDSLIAKNSSTGIYVTNYSYNSSISNCIIENNSSTYGGGIRIDSGSDDPTLKNCQIKNNTSSSHGGGVYINAKRTYMVGCEIYSNISSSQGGGIYNAGNAPQFINSVFAHNSAISQGSGMYLTGWTVSDITHCTIADNDGSNSSIYYGNGPKHSITNSIVWGNETGIGGLYLSNSTVRNSDIQGGWSYPGTGNIDVDPDFVNSTDWDYHLNASSSCINAGTIVNVFTDLDGNMRPIDFAYDMGAYEYNEITSDYGIISGYVMDSSNNPISAANVTLREYEAQGIILGTTTSNSDGYYKFNSLSNRLYIIEAEDGSNLDRRTGKTNKSLPWSMEEFINLYLITP
jgi:hypothetical protein